MTEQTSLNQSIIQSLLVLRRGYEHLTELGYKSLSKMAFSLMFGLFHVYLHS